MDGWEVALPGARAHFSSRCGGVSRGPYESLNLGILTGDDPRLVARNRALLAERVGLAPDAIAQGHQVHATEIKEWEGEWEWAGVAGPTAGGPADVAGPTAGGPAGGAELDEADGHVTEREGLGLLVLVADCLPLALAGGDRVAMLHCGWRGLAGGIVEKALARFTEPPAAALGPCIGPCCYEVGAEVLEAFAAYEGVADGRSLSLRAVAEAKLREAGIRRVEHVDVCTSCNPALLFSHRRDGGVTGRQGGLVVRA